MAASERKEISVAPEKRQQQSPSWPDALALTYLRVCRLLAGPGPQLSWCSRCWGRGASPPPRRLACGEKQACVSVVVTAEHGALGPCTREGSSPRLRCPPRTHHTAPQLHLPRLPQLLASGFRGTWSQTNVDAQAVFCAFGLREHSGRSAWGQESPPRWDGGSLLQRRGPRLSVHQSHPRTWEEGPPAPAPDPPLHGKTTTAESGLPHVPGGAG